MQDTSLSKPWPTLPIMGVGNSLEGRVARVWPAEQWQDLHVLLAVSGGADSVALLRVMVDFKRRHGGAGQLYVAHLHHGLRGAEADADQVWLTELCQFLGLPLWTGRVDLTEPEAREGWEAAARKARYAFLLETAERIGARFVATAHTADDQVETVFHRVLRGTGIDGLLGIPFSRPLSPSVTVVRPMLTVTRAEVLTYLAELQQEFRIDASNADPHFTRNWLRNELLPAIRKEVNPEVDGALLRLSQQAAEIQEWIASRAERLIAKSVETKQTVENSGFGEIRVAREPLRDEPPLLVREVCKRAWQRAGWPLRDMGHVQWQQLAKLVSAGPKRTVMLPGGIRAEQVGSTLVLQWRRPSEETR